MIGCKKKFNLITIYSFSLQLSTETWTKDVYELVDYDSDKLISSVINIKTTSFIYREDDMVISSPEKFNKKKDLLCQINVINSKGNAFELFANPFKLDETNTISANSPWFLLKQSKIDDKLNRYKLNSGDIIKIGRITLRIRDIYFSNKNISSVALNDSNQNLKIMNTLKTEGDPQENTNINPNKKTNINLNKNSDLKEKIKPITIPKNINKGNSIFTKIEKKNNVCRICYIEEEDPENPLLQPCICSGSMKFIHLSCLKHWISTRSCVKIDTTDNCSVYIIKPVECELCKTKFPDFIKHEGKLYALLDFSKEFENYLTLESLTLDKHKNKFIYVVSLKNKKMKMGRGHESDVLLSDISVSRIHCFLVIENKKVYLEDNNSKFGSLILIQNPIMKLEEGLQLNFQVGRSYIDCRIKRPFALFNCCNIEESSNIYKYYNLNEKQIQKHINLIVKNDYNEIDTENENDYKINNTFEQKNNINLDDKYNYKSLDLIEKDKISDNEYFMMKRHKLKKNETRALIDEDIENNKMANICENKSSDNESENKEEGREEEKRNKTENDNSENNNNENNDDENCNSNNQNETKNNQENTESIGSNENRETL